MAPVFWLTGRSGAGKTTLVDEVVRHLAPKARIKVLDGDIVRKEINPHLGFTPADIRENNRLIADFCVKVRADHDYVFVPVISPFEESRQQAREKIGDGFFLIYLRASLETVIDRDVKGLYRKDLDGKIPYFIGVDDRVPFEEPAAPDLVIDSTQETLLEHSASQFLRFIESVSVR